MSEKQDDKLNLRKLIELSATIDESIRLLNTIKAQIDKILSADLLHLLPEIDELLGNARVRDRRPVQILPYLLELGKIERDIYGVQRKCFTRGDAKELLHKKDIMMSIKTVERRLEELVKMGLLRSFKVGRDVMYEVNKL